MNPLGFATFVCLAWLGQLLMIWLQVKQHKGVMRRLIQTYHSQPELYMTSGRFSKFLRPASDVFLIIDSTYTVKDCWVKHGFTVFARYHREDRWIGVTIQRVMEQLDDSRASRRKSGFKSMQGAMLQACNQALSMESLKQSNKSKHALAGLS